MSSEDNAKALISYTDFSEEVEKYVFNHRLGFKEYDLLKHLSENNFFVQLPYHEHNSFALFQKHFLLFHTLYKINDNLVEKNNGGLIISPLNIQWLESQETNSMIGEYDCLREYYLDLNNLSDTSEQGVEEMLDQFWIHYIRNDKRKNALLALGLSDPVNDHEIKTCYHRLVKIHHPDKGGDTVKIQTINDAYSCLMKT